MPNEFKKIQTKIFPVFYGDVVQQPHTLIHNPYSFQDISNEVRIMNGIWNKLHCEEK